MSKLKQTIKLLRSDVIHAVIGLVYITIYLGIIILGSCIFTSIILKILYWFGGVSISSDADTVINFMLTYGIATFIIGWIGFRIYQVFNK